MPHSHHDMFTENPIRYLGYSGGFANAIGPTRINRYLYLITAGFIFSHTLYDPLKLNISQNASADKLTRSAVDTLIYETVASGLFPPAFARIVRSVGVQMLHKPLGSFAGWVASAATVGSLMIVSRPADSMIDSVMECSTRKMI